jgi:hypothetical protein
MARRRWYSAWAEAPGVPYACRRRRREAGAVPRLDGSPDRPLGVGLIGHLREDRLHVLPGERVDRQAGGVVVLPGGGYVDEKRHQMLISDDATSFRPGGRVDEF